MISFEAGRSPKILAYITAYQDEQSLKLCVGSIREQTLPPDHVLIVDNSPSPLLSQSAGLSVLHCPQNIGVGGGIVIALQRAVEQGYDFLWLLDQDSRPDESCLEQLTCFYHEQHRPEAPVALVAPRVIDQVMNRDIGGAVFERYYFKECLPDWQTDAWIECDAPIISGTLVAITAAREVPAPRQDLFLDGVDCEYGLTLRRAGFRNLITAKAVLSHRLGSPLRVKYGLKDYFIHNYSVLRTYYFYRNHTYLETHWAQPCYRSWALFHRGKLMLKEILLTLLFRDHKATRIYASILGTWHGLRGQLGKREKFP